MEMSELQLFLPLIDHAINNGSIRKINVVNDEIHTLILEFPQSETSKTPRIARIRIYKGSDRYYRKETVQKPYLYFFNKNVDIPMPVFVPNYDIRIGYDNNDFFDYMFRHPPFKDTIRDPHSKSFTEKDAIVKTEDQFFAVQKFLQERLKQIQVATQKVLDTEEEKRLAYVSLAISNTMES